MFLTKQSALGLPKKAGIVNAVSAMLLLTACVSAPYSEAPRPVNFPTTNQSKLQAAAHWKVIGSDLAETLVSNLPNAGCGKSANPCDRYYVKTARGGSPFFGAMRNELITTLVNKGYNIVRTPEGAKEINVDTQLVRFSGSRSDGSFTSYAVLGSGALVLRSVWRHGSHQAAVIGALAAGDVWRWFDSQYSGTPPQHEVIVTLSVLNGDSYIGRASNTYYINDNDPHLYGPDSSQLLPDQSFNLRGGM